jgi:hypothetical protein
MRLVVGENWGKWLELVGSRLDVHLSGKKTPLFGIEAEKTCIAWDSSGMLGYMA